MNKPTEKPGCSYCERTGYAWSDGSGNLICFQCLREQHSLYRDQVERLTEELAALQGTPAPVSYRPVLPNAAGQLISLRGDLRTLHETTGRILAKLPTGLYEEEKP